MGCHEWQASAFVVPLVSDHRRADQMQGDVAMKIGELFARRDTNFPTREEIVVRETAHARAIYPNATSDIEALAFAASTLRKNLKERTVERDRYHDSLTVRGTARLFWRVIKRELRGFVAA
jgi:hypothetical protein